MPTLVSLESLLDAYFECRKNKRNTLNALDFEIDYEDNLVELLDEILSGDYQPGRSIAFIINKPVKREIFAANFRDRVVHHWLIARLNPLFEGLFIYDSYASRFGRGAHFGIKRVRHFIQKCSKNHQKDCYILKLDIASFFVSINRVILWKMLKDFICQNYFQKDKMIVLDLAAKIALNNPTVFCIKKGDFADWMSFPWHKSLFYARRDCGLPIGNLTSQVFANFYLNEFDHFIKKDLGLRFYGRYVDDFVLVHEDKNFLKSVLPKMAGFLQERLGLRLHPGKIYLQHYNKGVSFLGVYIKPRYILIGRRTKGNFFETIQKQNNIIETRRPNFGERQNCLGSINSYLGIMIHYHTFHLRQLFLKTHLHHDWWQWFQVQGDFKKIIKKSQSSRYIKR